MKKRIIAFSIVVASMFLFTGCQKETVAWYKFSGLEEMKYVTEEEATATQFITELGNVIDTYSGTDFKDSELISSVSSVVDRYNPGVLSGTFSLTKSTESDSGPWTVISSWTMELDPKYTKAEDFEMNQISKLQ